MAQANFRIDDDQWEKFHKLCSANNKTASGVLKLFIDATLASRIDINELEQTTATPLDITNLVTDLVNEQVTNHLANVEYLIDTKVSAIFEQLQLQQKTPVEATTELNDEQLSQLLGVSAKTVKNNRTKLNYKNYHFVNGYWYELK